MAKRSTQTTTDRFVPYTDKVFKPYVAALGQLALAWNGLHETLSVTFSLTLSGKGFEGFVGHYLAIWHVVKADRAQRDMLLAAVESKIPGLDLRYPKLADDVKWIWDKANRIEDVRNDALHSPLWAYERNAEETIIMPVIGLGHVRAKKLFEKDILAEFRWCRDASLVLSEFARSINHILMALPHSNSPWPDRPVWPSRVPTKKKKPRPQARPAK